MWLVTTTHHVPLTTHYSPLTPCCRLADEQLFMRLSAARLFEQIEPAFILPRLTPLLVAAPSLRSAAEQALSCSLMLSHALSSSLILTHARPCPPMPSHAHSCPPMPSHALPCPSCTPMPSHALPCRAVSCHCPVRLLMRCLAVPILIIHYILHTPYSLLLTTYHRLCWPHSLVRRTQRPPLR